MPAQPACFHRLDEILGALRSMTSTYLDRAAVEKLFRVRIPAAADVRERLLEDLSVDITLRPGELWIAFCGAENLAAKLLEISQAMANDWPAFLRTVEENHPCAPRR